MTAVFTTGRSRSTSMPMAASSPTAAAVWTHRAAKPADGAAEPHP